MQESLSPVGYLPAVLLVHAQGPPATPGHRGECSPPALQPGPLRPRPWHCYCPHVLCHPGEGAAQVIATWGCFPFALSKEPPGQRKQPLG